ncbi:MAG: glycosyltransferase family 1 protein [Candidatus Daviesbacteria bacterium]|nr:glycosyltransferase family 1 protein [Candidatus Daviesbacteria bacterium]
MKIVIDARLWSESGLGRYIRNLVQELSKADLENKYYILLLKKDFDNVNLSNQNFEKVLADFKWYSLSEQIKLPKLLNSLKPDLVHFPHFNVPILYRGKFIVTIHDLIHQHYKTRKASTHNIILYHFKNFSYKKVFGFAVNHSIKIITPSVFVKKQLIDEWKIAADKIEVTPEGVDNSIIDLVKQVDSGDFQKVSHKFGINKPYLFYVGNAQPHKNISNLIKSFIQIKNKFSQYSLVLSGPEHYFWRLLEKENKVKDVIFTGHLSERELVALYKNAQVFIMPSFEEGFGLPILEAMACRVPVLSSNAASLPEVGGEAAIYFNPGDTTDIFEKTSKLLEDSKLRKELIKKGEKRFREFSWKKLTRETLDVYQKS